MTAPAKLDRIDLKILTELQKNGRITNVDLADAVGLSPSPCLTRVKRLEQAGYRSARRYFRGESHLSIEGREQILNDC